MYRYAITSNNVRTFAPWRPDIAGAYVALIAAAVPVQLRTSYDGPGHPETLRLEKSGVVIGFATLEWREEAPGRQADA